MVQSQIFDPLEEPTFSSIVPPMTVGRFRDSDILRQVFEAVMRACTAAGLVKGEGFAVDASVMEANASRYHGQAPDEMEWAEPDRQTRAVKEYLAALEAETELNPDRNHNEHHRTNGGDRKLSESPFFGSNMLYCQ